MTAIYETHLEDVTQKTRTYLGDGQDIESDSTNCVWDQYEAVRAGWSSPLTCVFNLGWRSTQPFSDVQASTLSPNLQNKTTCLNCHMFNYLQRLLSIVLFPIGLPNTGLRAAQGKKWSREKDCLNNQVSFVQSTFIGLHPVMSNKHILINKLG